MENVLIENIGKIVSGDLEKGVLDGDTIKIESGLISGIGWRREFDTKDISKLIDANGMVVIPGLIDSHTHPYLEDYTPISRNVGWMETVLLAGTTTLISAFTLCSGLCLDPVFVKSLAILAERKYKKFRPGGYLKVHAGTIILVEGLTERDFKEVAEQGVRMTIEIGAAGLAKPKDIERMVSWAKKYGILSSVHYGGRSIPGSSAIRAKDILEIGPDLVSHINGGSTAASLQDTEELISQSKIPVQIVYNSNPKIAYEVARILKEIGELHRLVLGSEMPVGTGLSPLAILREIMLISSLNEIPAQDVIASATGNTADLFRLNTGKVEIGREADLLIVDCPPDSVGKDALGAIEAGDMIGTAMVMVDGKIVTLRGRDTRPTTRNIKINGTEYNLGELTADEWCFGPTHPGY